MNIRISFFLFFLTFITACDQQKNVTRNAPSNPTPGSIQVLATISDEHTLISADNPEHGANITGSVIFNSQGTSVAYITVKDKLFSVVHNGRTGNLYQSISDMAFSPDGKRLSYIAQKNDKKRFVVDSIEGSIFDFVGSPVFTRDSRHFLYYASSGNKWFLAVDNKSNDGGLTLLDQFFSLDDTRVVSIEATDSGNDSIITSYDLKLTPLKKKKIAVHSRCYNKQKSRMAAISEQGGKKRVVEMTFDNLEVIKEGALYDNVSMPTFISDDTGVAYIAENGVKRFLMLNGNTLDLPAGIISEPPVIHPGNKDAGLIVSSPTGFDVYPFISKPANKKRYDESAYFSYNSAGDLYLYAAKIGKRQFYVINGNEGPSFDRVLAPRFTPDGKHAIGRVKLDEKRSIVLIDATGKLVKQCPSFEMVFEPVFSEDGKTFGYGAKDGKKLIWITEKLP